MHNTIVLLLFLQMLFTVLFFEMKSKFVLNKNNKDHKDNADCPLSKLYLSLKYPFLLEELTQRPSE